MIKMESSAVNVADTPKKMKKFGTAQNVKMLYAVKSATINITSILLITTTTKKSKT